MGLLGIRQIINGLKLIWIRKVLNDNHIWKNIISVMIPIVRTHDVHGPCLPLKKITNQFWRHTLQAYKSFCRKVNPAKAEEFVTEPLFYNDKIEVGNNATQNMD